MKNKGKEELKLMFLGLMEEKGIPDFKEMFEGHSSEIIFEVLNDLLEEEKKKFKNDLLTPKEKITFEIFHDRDRLGYLFGLVSHYEKVQSSEKTRDIIKKFQPLYVEFLNEIGYSKEYYDMMVYCRDNTQLNDNQKRILDKSIRNFEANGINLPEEKKDILKKINLRLADLKFKFSNNKLDSEKQFSYLFESDETIKEMSEEDLKTARKKASDKGKEGFLFGLDVSGLTAVLSYCKDPEIRKKFYVGWKSVASSGEFDNRPLILEMLELRKQEAEILGFKNFAEVSLFEKMADTQEEVIGLSEKIAERAGIKSKVELAELREYFGLNRLNQWDINFYSTKLKKEKYDIDETIVKQYYEFENLLEGLLEVAKKLYDLDFEIIDAPKYDPSIRTFKVFRKGKFLSYYILDAFYRKEKTSGAWAECLRSRFYEGDIKDELIAVNVSAFQKGEEKTLITGGEARTLFHEFGHALHLMLYEGDYFQELNGFKIEWDFIELFSRLMENWFYEKESKKNFAFHYKTGEIMPEEMMDKIESMKNFMNGYYTQIQMQYSLLDMILYCDLPPKTIDELDKKVLTIMRNYSPLDVVDEIKFHTGFAHIFGGGYEAGYYSYYWAEIYEADVFREFKKNGMFDKLTSERFLETIYSKGTTKPAKELFQDFIGREVDLEAYFEKQGF